MSKTIGTVLVNVEANTQKLIDGFNSAEKRVDSAVSTMKKSVIGLTTAYLSFEGIVGGGKMFLQQADAMNSASSRLKLVTANSQELLNVQKQLFTVANDTRTGYIKTIDLYTNITNGAKEYGVEQAKILTTTDAINKSIIIGGASSVATEAAMEQLGQAFISNFKGVGQELGSLRDQAPRLYKAMVEGMGVTSDQFKKMAEDGELSTEIIINAILKGTASIDKDFSQMAKTTAQGVELILNQYLKIVDGIDNKFEISSSTVASLNQITDVLSNINSYLDGLSPEEVQNITEYIKNMGIAIVGSYTAIKTAQTVYSVYNSILELNAKIVQENTTIEQERTKAITLGEKATKVRKLADEARNTAQASGLLIAENHYKMLNKEAFALEAAAKKQQAYSYQLESTAKGFNASAIGANLLKGALSTIPFMAISVGISAIATSLLTASDNSEILEKTIKSTGEELSKLTQNQLEYRKALIETAIQEQKEVVNWQQMKAGIVGFKSEIEKKKQKSILDDEKQKLTQMQVSYKDLTDTLNNYNKQTLTTTQNTSQTPIVRDDSAVIKIMGSEFSKFNLELDENIKKLKNSGATQAEVDKYRADSIKNFNEKQQKDSKKTNDELIKQAEETSKAYSETARIGMSDYNKSLISIADKVGAWTKAGVDNIEILRVQGILLDELNQKQALETTKTDLSYYERKVQLQTESYEKELELQGISYGQKVLDIEGSSGESAEKERLIELEAELYNATVARMELERNTEFQETISGFYDDMLESQISLNSALYDFGDGFGEVGNKIASVSKSLATMTNADLKSKKEIAKLNDKYAKEFKKYSKDETKTKELVIAYEEEEQQLKQQTLMNQIGGLSEFAGQSKQFFGEQTGAYKALQAIEAVGHAARMAAMAAELPGQITSLSVNIANALAGQGSIPIVGFALVVGMAALLAGLGVMSAGGGGGGSASSGGGSSKPSQFDIKEQELEDLYTPMTDRLDRQIELLESIDKQGTASAVGLVGAKISFEKDYALAVNEINKKLPTDVRGYGLDFNDQLAPIEAALGFNIADVIRIKKSGWDKSEKRIYTDFGSLNSGNNMIKLISAYFEDTSKNGAIAALFGGHNALNLAANEIQKTIGDFTSGIVDSLDDLKDASSDFKDHYDTITGSMHYENKKLADAFKDVQALTNGKTFAEYLKQNIDEIDTLSNTFSDAVVNTLLSQDPADMAKQLAVLEDLQNQTGLVFKGGAKDALDFLESIELVATAMSTSSSNIKDFIDGFKSEDLLALDLSNKLGTNLALNYDDLALKFKEMASDIYGLTDAELEFLDANKSYIERIQDAKKQALEDELELTKSSVSTIQSMSNSLDSVITKLRGNLSTTTANSLLKFNESMASTMLLSNGNDYKALEDSLKNTISYSDALNNADYFNSSRDMQFAQAIAANQFESMDVKLEDELTVLQQISANTSAMIEALENSASFDIYAQNLETSVKIKAFANGGIVTGPTFGLIGEAGYSEAVIPLKNPNDPLGQKELIAEIRALRKEVADLNNSSSKTAENTTPSRYVS